MKKVSMHADEFQIKRNFFLHTTAAKVILYNNILIRKVDLCMCNYEFVTTL